MYYEQALAALGHLPEGREATEQAIDLRLDLYAPLALLRDYDRIGDLLQQAEALMQNPHPCLPTGRSAAIAAGNP